MVPAAVDPGLLLGGSVPRLIDEWQVEPGLWNHVRRAVDDRGLPGQFVLTGSSVPADDVARHTGAGRFSFLRMRPMTLFESGYTNGGAGADRLLADLNLLGLLFESLVVRDLRVLAQPLEGQVFHYRDNYGVEADAVVQLADGRWGAFEIKLGAGLVDEGAKSLLRFRDSIDTSKSGEPSVLAVIAGTGFGYLRPDGIAVIPVGSLAP